MAAPCAALALLLLARRGAHAVGLEYNPPSTMVNAAWAENAINVDETDTEPPEQTVDRGYVLYRAYTRGRNPYTDACHEWEQMLAAPCFVNEGTTTVNVPNVKGYTFGCGGIQSFKCPSALVGGDNAGRNQRCVACVRRWGGRCTIRTVFDQSCG